jgi:SAM-dependent methyltransferase
LKSELNGGGKMSRHKKTTHRDATRPASEFYDALGESYERMINWDARIERESPFFQKLFEERNVKSVLDVACGTGHHTVEFARWDVDATGCDISAEMLRLARRNAAEAGVSAEFFEAGLTDVDKGAGGRKFDAIVCLGNSLPHLLTQSELDRSMRSIRRALDPGGVFVSQIRNYARILRDNVRFMPPTSAEVDGGECVFFRMLDIHGPRRVDFHIVRMINKSGKWTHDIQTTPLRPITKAHLNNALRRAGFRTIHHFSDYSSMRFGINKTMDLITVAG